jgi:hypothetical protein
VAASGATEVVAYANQIVNDSLSFNFHRCFGLEVILRQIIVDQIFGQVKTFNWDVDQSKLTLYYAPIFSEK